ncbi:tetracycline resistance MFS efflux pump, partial [Mesorhizobium sp. M7A.F.Ca.ET.027.03.2.1]
FGGAPYLVGACFLTLACIVFVTKVARPAARANVTAGAAEDGAQV